MRLVEYKKHKEDGGIKDPSWIMEGGLYPDVDCRKWLGIIENEVDIKYYIPEGVRILTFEECLQRQYALHAANPFIRADLDGEVSLTHEEIKTELISICRHYGVEVIEGDN